MRIFVLSAVFVLAAGSADAQMTAKQGVRPIEQTQFESPMILDVPFTAAEPFLWGQMVNSNEPTGKFICDGVSLADLRFRTDKPKKGKQRISIVATLKNEPGIDKLVNVKFELVDGEKVIGKSAMWKKLDVEEGKQHVPSAAHLEVPADELKAAKSPKLRITVETKDNG